MKSDGSRRSILDADQATSETGLSKYSGLDQTLRILGNWIDHQDNKPHSSSSASINNHHDRLDLRGFHKLTVLESSPAPALLYSTA
jgi:hypothetical protein